jgi:TonB family protein
MSVHTLCILALVAVATSVAATDTAGERHPVAGVAYGDHIGQGITVDSLLDTVLGSDLGKGFVRGGSLVGKRTRRDVLGTVVRGVAPIRNAYNRRLKESADLAGTVLVRFRILSDGRVLDCGTTKSTLPDSILVNRVVKIVAGWRFSRMAGTDTTTVLYPFTFTRQLRDAR